MKKINNLFAFIAILVIINLSSSVCFAQVYQSNTGLISVEQKPADYFSYSNLSPYNEDSYLKGFNNKADSLNMNFLGKALYGDAWSVFISGPIAYVGTSTSLMIFDITIPFPQLLGHYHHSYAKLASIHVVGDYAYLALNTNMSWGAEGAIGIIDISNPANPVEVSCFETSGDFPGAWSIYTQGNYSYAAVGTGLLILDVSNPVNPVQISSLDFGGEPNFTYSVEVVENYAYVAAGGAGLKIVDISDPANPVVMGTYPTPDHWARQVKVIGNYAYLFSSFMTSLFEVIDITDPTNPTFVGSIAPSDAASRMDINGSYAYIGIQETPSPTGLTGGLEIIDISDPTVLSIAGSCEIEGGAVEVSVANNFCYVAAKGGGFMVISVTFPTNPSVVSSFHTGQLAYSIEVVGDYAYIADRNAHWPNKGSLRIVDVTNTLSPIELGVFETGGEARTVSIEYPYAYIADGFNGFCIADISDPNSITGVGTYQQTGMYVNDIIVKAQYVYIACNDNFQIVDISDPVSPVLVGELGFSSARSVFLKDNLAFVSTISGSGSEKGMQIVDISTPASPVVLGSFASTGQYGTWQIHVLNNLAYLADSQGGLIIVDISDPANPVEAGNYLTSGIAASIFVSGSYAYVGILSDKGSIMGVEVIDVSDLSNLNIVGYYTLFDVGYDVFVADNIIYMASGTDGLNILEFTGGTTSLNSTQDLFITKVGNFPNPFNTSTTIKFTTTGSDKNTMITVYNFNGQKIKTLVNKKLNTGTYQIVWDGTDYSGNPVSSGIYFCKMKHGDKFIGFKKMILMK